MSLIELARSTSSFMGPSHEDGEFIRPSSFATAFAAVVVCGTLNNLSYCIISGASQNLARQFNASSQVTLLTTAMNMSALAATFISTRFLLRLRYYTRIRLVLAMAVAAYTGVAAAAMSDGWVGFVVAALFSCIAGMSQVFGETTNLAFLKSFPAELIGGWGAGTGVAGIAGSGMYILLTGPFRLSNTTIFLLMVPTQLIYWAAFHYLHTQAVLGQEGFRLARVLGGTSSAEQGADGMDGGESQPGAREALHESSTGTAPATCENLQAAIKVSGGIMFNLVAVYMLEYLIYPGLVDRETHCASTVWYTTMWMCYNVGVTLSRLSVAAFRIRRVWALTAFQLFNVVGWTMEVYTGVIRKSLPQEGGYYILAAWMVLVGLCGGATYGNCMYLFNRQAGIPDNLRELGINLGFVMSNIGITIATLSFSLFNETILRDSLLYAKECQEQLCKCSN